MTALIQGNALVFFPHSGEESNELTPELARASWVGFGAHADDIEIGIPLVYRRDSDNSQLVAVIVRLAREQSPVRTHSMLMLAACSASQSRRQQLKDSATTP